jgi:hypothetical protein
MGKPSNQNQCQTGAGEGNRTLVVSLENFCSTIELHPQRPNKQQAFNATAKQQSPQRPTKLPKSKARIILVEGEGFEPSKAEPSDLQSDPFDRSGTPPNRTRNYADRQHGCQIDLVKPASYPATRKMLPFSIPYCIHPGFPASPQVPRRPLCPWLDG